MSSGADMREWVERAQRHRLDTPALAIRADGSSLSVRLRDISYDGCRLEGDTVLSVGEKITLALPRMGEVKAQVRWVLADGKAGTRFVLEEILIAKSCSTAGL